jgi:hypothetical protein
MRHAKETATDLYTAGLRPHRTQPSPNSALPKSASDIGSGTALVSFSPLDIGALADAVVVAKRSKVVQLEAGVQASGISIQSKVSVVPTGPKAARNAASPEIAVVVPVPKNFGWGVLSWIVVMCQLSVILSPLSGFV